MQTLNASLPWQLRIAPLWSKEEGNWFWEAEAAVEAFAADL